ncbi:MAG: polyprenyl synthetase family protein [Chloroflexaceae bacterium]
MVAEANSGALKLTAPDIIIRPAAPVAGSGFDPAAPGAAVVAAVQTALQEMPALPAYRVDLAAALELPGNALADAPDMRWARQVWTCCMAAGGHWSQAVPVAAAVEIFMVALDLLDDLEDNEAHPLVTRFGPARALNVSTGLLLLAQQQLLISSPGPTAVDMLLSTGLHACSGQDADLGGLPPQDDQIHVALEITSWKSATLVATVCRLGALCAGADAAVQAGYARLGWHMGMMAQLANDIRAVAPDATEKTDIRLGRPTLPLVYADCRRGDTAAGGDTPATRARLWNGASVYLTWAVVETYRRQARDLIAQLTPDPQLRVMLLKLLPAITWVEH